MSIGEDMANTDINMKDHDILIATYTLQQELVRRFDEYIKSNDERHQRASVELNETRRKQVQFDGEIVNVKGLVSNLDEKIERECEQMNKRVSKSEGDAKWFNVAAIIGSIVAGAISILVWVIK